MVFDRDGSIIKYQLLKMANSMELRNLYKIYLFSVKVFHAKSLAYEFGESIQSVNI